MKKQLLHDMSPDDFADMYAQTLVYGLFVARFHDTSPDTFTRSEARDLVPASNPLLKHFFDHIAGVDFDDRLDSIVDELCMVFSHSDISKLISNYYGTEKGSKDPVIHFYEDFLQEYDSKKRKEFGAYYTPLPVVKFIVNAVDHILEKDFKLAGGLANSSKNEKGHIVQVLDPATGTGTFLTEVIKLIHDKKKNQSGIWGKYVLDDVLPRLFGFEIMIAPYTIAHLKMSMLLKETGFKYFNNRRLGIYLTNSLQEANTIDDMFSGFGLAESISDESKEASKIKKEKPIMVVLGNPPYSVNSQNKGEWINDLMKDYKKNLDERNIQPLSDDYIKFIRFAESFIEKNKTGVVAMITNNSFLDGTIHRQMRKHLLETFDDIYIVDLHGNAKKKEVAPDGSKDENVFDIQQGVSINIFVKRNEIKSEKAQIYFDEIYGTRKKKFEYLEKPFSSVDWENISFDDKTIFFVPKVFKGAKKYSTGFGIDDLFNLYNAGTATGKDSLLTGFNEDELIRKLNDAEIKFDLENITPYLYRPFDSRKIIYENKLIQRLRTKVMDNMLQKNIALLTCKKQTTFDFQHIFVTDSPSDRCSVSLQTGEVGYIFPLFLYDEQDGKNLNFNNEIIHNIQEIVGEVESRNVFNYVYAILHNLTYRVKYKEFLKIDFPRIPYPKNRKTFDKLAKLGSELIQYHLLEHEGIDPYQISYLGEGDNIVEKPEYKNGKVYINTTQYFGNVSEVAWKFYIGGYQPAQKWLKDRKGRELSPDDIEHYSKIVIALRESNRLMKDIDKISIDS